MGENAFRTRGYLRIFASYYKPHWKLFALDMVCALCICLVDLTFPVASRYSMQNLLPGRQFGAFFAVMALLALAYVLKGVLICSPTCRSCPSPFMTRTAPASS